MGRGRWGGASTAAVFLEHFSRDTKWAHIDIASRMKSQNDENLAKGAVGEPVQALLENIKPINTN